MALLPIAVWGLEVPAGDMAVSCRPDIPSAYRITMAAIDPTEAGRSTLKIMRLPLQYEDSDDEEFDADEMEAMLAEDSEGSEDSDDEVNGGPSDPAKSKKARKAAAVAQIKELLEEEEDMEVDGEDEDEDDEDDEDLDGAEIEEFVVCTLDSEKQYQQTLDITVGENEQFWFKVTGKSSIYLTGNYVETAEDSSEYDSEEEDEYDLEPDMDEELDELDSLSDRVVEIEEEVPALVGNGKVDKGKKRAVEDLDGMITQDKKSKKQKKEEPKKVAFAKEIEQGPTPSAAPAKTKSVSVKTVQGVTLDDRKLGSGPVIKKGDRVGIRYIGKLKDGKVFDSNKKGKPFTFKAGANEVVKGMDIGVTGMSVGGERRVIIPASLGYGSKSLPDIPANSQLTFDIKVVEVNKGK